MLVKAILQVLLSFASCICDLIRAFQVLALVGGRLYGSGTVERYTNISNKNKIETKAKIMTIRRTNATAKRVQRTALASRINPQLLPTSYPIFKPACFYLLLPPPPTSYTLPPPPLLLLTSTTLAAAVRPCTTQAPTATPAPATGSRRCLARYRTPRVAS